MGKVVGKQKDLRLDEVKAAITFDQPKLLAAEVGPEILVSGTYLLFENGAIADPAGPISTFDVEIRLSKRYPNREPKVFEVGGRIPRHPDRHINSNGDCCVTVWEHWLTCAPDTSFAAFLNGPFREFLLSQLWFENTGQWPFGERAHGAKGLQEAYAECLGIPNNKEKITYHLRLLSKDWPKGHWLCPCGSTKVLRHCHKDSVMALHGKIPPRMARQMLHRLTSEGRQRVFSRRV